ncbi:MAG: glycosyltransferase [Candidatus Auribacterota bacterium]
MNPIVSVALPVYNGERFLFEAVSSVFAQSLSDFELIIVDDGSTDRTPAIISRFAQSDTRVRVIRNDTNKGIIPSLNSGIETARAPFIARMDADDRMHPERLAEQVAFLEKNTDIDVVSCLVEKFSETGIREGYSAYMQWLNSLCTHEDMRREMFVESPIAHPSVMMRTGTLRCAGGYQDHGWPEDYDLWLRLLRSGVRFGKVRKVLHYWRDRQDRLSRVDDRYSLINFHRCKAHYLAGLIKKNSGKVVIWGAKRKSRQFSSLLKPYGIEFAAYVDVDRKIIGTHRDGIPVIAPEGLRDYSGYPVVCYVSADGARRKIRDFLVRAGYTESVDFFMLT